MLAGKTKGNHVARASKKWRETECDAQIIPKVLPPIVSALCISHPWPASHSVFVCVCKCVYMHWSKQNLKKKFEQLRQKFLSHSLSLFVI